MYVLGISCFYHDSAACLIKDGVVVAAAQEERFSRKKHDFRLPKNAVNYCLKEAGIEIGDVDHVGFYDKPFIKFERMLYTYIATFPRSLASFATAIPLWLGQKLHIPKIIKKELGYEKDVLMIEHHMSHAASSFLVSPFKEAAILTVDGVGEWATSTFGKGSGNKIELIKETRFPDSLGLLYSAITYFLGFKVNSAEYKVMGLAPYGEPKYADLIMDNLIDIKDDGSFKTNMKYFAYDYGLKMTNSNMDKLFKVKKREPESELEQVHKDIAASVQKVTEIAVLRMCDYLYKEVGGENLCMAGGVALNCVANGRILRESKFKNLFIQPAAGDAGGAVGVAMYIYNSILDNPRTEPLHDSYLGPSYSDSEIKGYFDENNVKYHKLKEDELVKKVAHLIEKDQAVIGWFQGRMEFGPRSLGNRSIIADAKNKENWQRVNLKIKYRESFRPFAPSVLEEKADNFFDLRGKKSPYMLLVAQVNKDKRVVPAVTHVDGSARIQTVSKKTNPMFHRLIEEVEKLSGVPILINTSFNVRGEPIVCTPHDAYMCFMRTEMDYLVVGNFLLDKKEMKKLENDIDWQQTFELD